MSLKTNRKFYFGLAGLGFGIWVTILGSLTTESRASMSPEDYLKALKIAEQKVLRQKSAAAATDGALSSSAVKSVYGRYYQVGDSWDVAAWRFDNTIARMTDDVQHLGTRTVKGGIFHYEVVEVKGGTHPRVVLHVTQKEEFGMKAVDPRVEKLMLTFDDKVIQTQKAYKFSSNGEPVRVSAEGIHSRITALELYPLDVPEFVTAERLTAHELPELPEATQGIVKQTGFKPDLTRSFRFEQEDFFGRPVQFFWQFGDPWPAMIKTSNGIAILIRKGNT